MNKMNKMNEIMDDAQKCAVLETLQISEEKFIEIHNLYCNKSIENENFIEHFPVEIINGKMVVRNKILLVAKYKEYNELYVYCNSMLALKMLVFSKIKMLNYEFVLLKHFLSSDKYEISNGGLCLEVDTSSIRYTNHERENGVFKMRAGKFLRKIFEENKVDMIFPEQVITWVCEEFASEWKAYAESVTADDVYDLVVDEDFKTIYTAECCKGNFGSCMSFGECEFEDEDNCHYKFYEKSVSASAASLRTKDGDIVARAIIFNDVIDAEGNSWRLCERQYASDGSNDLKRILVNRLIAAKRIDGYKKVGAGCHDNSAFLDKDGNDISNKRFKVRIDLEFGDHLSYQDSFVGYDGEFAYNFKDSYYYLNKTDDYYKEGRNYDEYHDEYTDSEVISVRVNGLWMTCSEDDLCDFCYVEEIEEYVHYRNVVFCQTDGNHYEEDSETIVEVNGRYYREDDDDIVFCGDDEEYHLYDDVFYCEDDEEYHLDYNCFYCEELELHFTSKDAAEKELESRGYIVGEFSYEWVNDDITEIHTECGIVKDSISYLILNKEDFVLFNGQWYTNAGIVYEMNNELCEMSV